MEVLLPLRRLARRYDVQGVVGREAVAKGAAEEVVGVAAHLVVSYEQDKPPRGRLVHGTVGDWQQNG